MLYDLNDNFTGVNANANLQIRITKRFTSVLHRQCREATPDGMILMRLRRAKHRHDAVTL